MMKVASLRITRGTMVRYNFAFQVPLAESLHLLGAQREALVLDILGVLLCRLDWTTGKLRFLSGTIKCKRARFEEEQRQAPAGLPQTKLLVFLFSPKSSSSGRHVFRTLPSMLS